MNQTFLKPPTFLSVEAATMKLGHNLKTTVQSRLWSQGPTERISGIWSRNLPVLNKCATYTYHCVTLTKIMVRISFLPKTWSGYFEKKMVSCCLFPGKLWYKAAHEMTIANLLHYFILLIPTNSGAMPVIQYFTY